MNDNTTYLMTYFVDSVMIMNEEVTATTESSNRDETPPPSDWEDQCLDPYHENIENGKSEGHASALKASYKDGRFKFVHNFVMLLKSFHLYLGKLLGWNKGIEVGTLKLFLFQSFNFNTVHRNGIRILSIHHKQTT